METSHFIPTDKESFKLRLMASGFLLACGLFGWLYMEDTLGFVNTHGINSKLYILTIVITLIGVGAVAFSLINLLNANKGVYLDEEGFVLNTSFYKMKKIGWANILDLQDKKHFGNTFILVILKDTNLVMDAMNPLQRWFARQNIKTYHTPVIINLSLLEGKNETMKAVIEEFWKLGKSKETPVA